MSKFYAHTGDTDHQDCGDWQLLAHHLGGVARGAKNRAAEVGLDALPGLAEAGGWSICAMPCST